MEDTDRALGRMTVIVVGSGGYGLGSETNVKNGYKNALVKVAVPVDRFEEVQRQLRGLAVDVLCDQASGQDVAIWLIIVVVPFAVPLGLLIWYLVRRENRKRAAARPPGERPQQ